VSKSESIALLLGVTTLVYLMGVRVGCELGRAKERYSSQLEKMKEKCQ